MWLMAILAISIQLTETTYGQFDFDSFQKASFQDLVVRLAIMFGAATLVIHMLDFVFVSTYIQQIHVPRLLHPLPRRTATPSSPDFIFLFRLDRVRLAVLTAGSALFYLFWLWYLVAGRNYLA